MWHLSYWYLGAGGWVLFSIVLAQVFPRPDSADFYQTKKLENETLLQRLQFVKGNRYQCRRRIPILKLSKTTRKGNAMLAGLGKDPAGIAGRYLARTFGQQQLK